MISIIIPSYNRPNILDKCLGSIYDQDFPDYEIILVNDGSKDDMSAVYHKYQQIFGKKITIINQENQGSNPARNNGFKLSNGELVLFCDSDLILRPDMLTKLKLALDENPNASYAYPSHYFGKKLFRLWPFDPDKLRKMPYIHTTALIRREHFTGFDNNIKRFQDWDLWLSMLEKGYVGVWVPEPLFQVATGGTISEWMPSFIYKIMPFLPSVKKYKLNESVIKKKHGLI